jgi:hypothetical protein
MLHTKHFVFLLSHSSSHLLFASTGIFIFISIVQLDGAIKICSVSPLTLFMTHGKSFSFSSIARAVKAVQIQEFLAAKTRYIVNLPTTEFSGEKTGKCL